MNRDQRAKLIKVGRRIYLAVLATVAVGLVVTRRSEVTDLLAGTRPLLLMAALVASFGLIGLGSGFWTVTLSHLGHPTPFREVVLATTRALPARYVPLGVSFAIARGALLHAAGVSTIALATTAVLEITLSVAVALAAGTAILGTVGDLPGGLVWTAVVSSVAVGGTSPLLGGRLVSWFANRRGITLTITWRVWLRLLCLSAVYWASASATFVLYLRAFPAADSFGTIEVAGAFMTSWAVGFLTVLAPQGLGVTEVGLVTLLAADENPAIAFTVIFVGYRLVQIARDAISATIAETVATQRARRESAPTGR